MHLLLQMNLQGLLPLFLDFAFNLVVGWIVPKNWNSKTFPIIFLWLTTQQTAQRRQEDAAAEDAEDADRTT